MRSWEDLKIFQVTVSVLVPAYTEEGAREHIEKSSLFPNKILEIKELSRKEQETP